MEQVVLDERTQKVFLLPWWLILIDGILCAILGVLLLAYPISTLTLLIIFLGAYWFVGGIFHFIGAFVHKEHRAVNIFMGLLGLVAGAAILINPVMGDIVVPGMILIILGVDGVLIGAAAMFQAFRGAGVGRLIFGIFSMVVGLVLLFNEPFAMGISTVPFVFGILGVVIGVSEIAAAFSVRKLQKA